MSRRESTSDFKDANYAVGRSYLATYPDGGGRSGIFVHPAGFARVFVSETPRRSSTFIIFIHAGRTWSRNWDAAWGNLTVARLAREFIEEVVAR